MSIQKYHKSIIFCKTKLNGHFRYRNEFQIYPADFENMPKSSFQKHYPIVLEYVINEGEQIVVNDDDFLELNDLQTLTATTITKEDKILALLTLFTNHLFFRYFDLTGSWGIPILKENPGKEANSWSSKWCLPQFIWPGYPEQFKISEFAHLQGKDVQYVNTATYYFKNPNFDYYQDSEITFPDLIYQGLDSYFLKPEGTKKVLNSAMSFIRSAMELRQYRKTMSIIASFTAIETMVNFEYKDFKPSKCEKCGQEEFKVAQRYRDYLLKYLGHSDHNRKKFTALYKFRSSIIHTGRQLKTENLYSGLTKDEEEKEFLTHIEILQISKLSIVQWLILNPNHDDRSRNE